MALTPEQIQAIRTKAGVAPTPTQGVSLVDRLKTTEIAPKENPLVGGVVGVAKGVAQSVTDLAGLAQFMGQGFLAGITPGMSFEDVRKETGIKSLDKATPEGQTLQSTLEATTPAQKVGKVGEQIAELAIPIVGLIGKGIQKSPTIAKALEQASLRMTPAVKRDLGTKLNTITQYLLDKKVIGNPTERLGKIDDIYQGMEKTLQNFLNTNNTAKGIFVPKTGLVEQLEKLKTVFRSHRDVITINKQIDDAISSVNAIFKQQKIPIARLNEFKRTTFESAFNKAGSKVLDDVEFAIGEIAKKTLEKATKGLKVAGKDISAFNHEYGTVISARNILKAAESRDEIGILGKIISTMIGGTIGGTIGGPIGSGVGILAGAELAPVIAGTKVRSVVAGGANVVGKVAPFVKKATGPLLKTGAGILGKDVSNLLNE